MNPGLEDINESEGSAIVFGGPAVNGVVGQPWLRGGKLPSEKDAASTAAEKLLSVTAPPKTSSGRVRPPFGNFSAPDIRTLRLLYGVDPLSSLGPGVRRAAFAVDGETGTKIVRRW
jgi:hypothetical protein